MTAAYASPSRRHSRGSALVATALATPFFAAFVFGVLQMSFTFYIYGALNNGAREGARYASLHPTDVSGIQSTVKTRIVIGDQTNLTINVTYPDGTTSADSRVQVSLSYPVPIFAPAWPALTLSTASTMRVEP